VEIQVKRIETSISSNINRAISTTVGGLLGFGIAFYKGWLLALIMTALMPLQVVVGVLVHSNYEKTAGIT
jgi:ABC-type antimicrobial peptide transport system permease subunit